MTIKPFAKNRRTMVKLQHHLVRFSRRYAMHFDCFECACVKCYFQIFTPVKAIRSFETIAAMDLPGNYFAIYAEGCVGLAGK